MPNMAFIVYYLVFSGFIFAVAQAVAPKNLNEWKVERSSVNPFSYTDEAHYFRDGTTENPLLTYPRGRMNCPANEHFTRCDANCEKTCDNYKKPIPCPRLCIWGCICKFGFVRGPDKKCIKSTECPTKSQAVAQQNIPTDISDTQSEDAENSRNSEKENSPTSKSSTWPIPIPLVCGKNEQLDLCPSSCPDDCNNFRNKNRKCMKICIPSCVCMSGLVRSHDGKCIKPYECHQEKNFCPSGEEYSPCHSHCEDNCAIEDKSKNNCHIDGILCVPGCTCKAGLVRGPDGTCIYRTECPSNPSKEPPTKICPENELFDECKAACQRNCSNVDSALPCPRICISGCVCKESLIRGKYGKCIEKDECPKSYSEQDPYVTLNPPPYTDDDYHIPESVTEILPISETESSQFEEILPIRYSKPVHKCPPRHRWVVCGGHCERNCSNKDDKDFRCRPVCIPGCICEEGLVKGPEGKCIEKEKCPSKSDLEGDSYVTLNPLSYTDDDYHIPESVTEILPISETESSQFEEILPIRRSKPAHKCPPKHRWVVCGGHCERNCSNKDDKDFSCRPVCIPGCICEEGLVKGPEGKCIEKEKCPTKSDSEGDQFPFPIPNIICGKDENRELCPSTCPDDCNNYKDTNRKCGKVCVPACICKKGFVKGPKGKCIKPNECPDDKKDNCKQDELYSQCHGNCEKNCSNWAFDLICPDACVSGCVCKPGRIRGPDGNCILWSKCPRHHNTGIASFENQLPIKSAEESCQIVGHLCPDDKNCDCACRKFGGANRGECTGPENMECVCHRNGRAFKFI